MAKREYVPRRFQSGTLEIIERAEQICSDYARQGLGLTLRQLYYRFVANGWIANKDSEYDRLGSIINDARLAGYIDWYHLEDRTRNLQSNSHWSSPGGIIQGAAYGYMLDRWERQPVYVEAWIEKDALVGVLSRVCRRWDVPYFSCRGYTSQSEVWRAAQRIIDKSTYYDEDNYRRTRPTVILHLGDHDPSGLDMTRDIADRLHTFITHDGHYAPEIRRLALNMDQVRQYDPPPNPAKMSDGRAAKYVKRYGYDSWELDALEPTVIDALVEAAIKEHVDQAEWDRVVDTEAEDKKLLALASSNWDKVASYLATLG